MFSEKERKKISLKLFMFLVQKEKHKIRNFSIANFYIEWYF